MKIWKKEGREIRKKKKEKKKRKEKEKEKRKERIRPNLEGKVARTKG